MREILFKAKCKDNGEWVEGYVVFCNGKINPGQAYIAPVVSSIIALEDWAGLRLGPFVEVYPQTICQYTGLTDKNGKKIFESDIVVAYNEDGTKSKWVVSFQSGCWIVETEKSWDFLETNARDIEVIGNIHNGED